MSTDTQEKEKVEVMTIQEATDGSAVVELPESIPSPDVAPEDKAAAPEDDSDEADDAARQAEMADGGEVDPEQEEIRAAKRAKRRARKEYHRNVEQEKNVKTW
jgi:hypothetical protein